MSGCFFLKHGVVNTVKLRELIFVNQFPFGI